MRSREPDRSGRGRIASGIFAGVLLVIGVGAWLIAGEARDAVLDSESGSINAVALDPSAPGFRAFTEPTPTALVLHTAVTPSGGAELRGLSLLTGADGDRGGNVVGMPASLVAPAGGDPLDSVFVDEGFDAVVRLVRETTGIGFGDVVVLDAASWTTLMVADLPLELSLREPLVETGGSGESTVLLAPATRPFELAEVALIAGHRNPDEPTLTVARRQQEIWRSWISRTAGAAERPDLFAIDEGFVDLLGTLASGEVSYRMIPARTVSAADASDTTYSADADAIADLVATIVPFPLSPTPGARPDVMLLDGTGGSFDRTGVLHGVVRAGGQVAILGNADAGTLAMSEVQIHNRDATTVATAIAEAIGAGPPIVVPLDEATVSITVIVGADLALDP